MTLGAAGRGESDCGDWDAAGGSNTGRIAREEGKSVDENRGQRGQLAAALEPVLSSRGRGSTGEVGSFGRSDEIIKITWGRRNASRECRKELKSGQRDGEGRGAETSFGTSQLIARMGERAASLEKRFVLVRRAMDSSWRGPSPTHGRCSSPILGCVAGGMIGGTLTPHGDREVRGSFRTAKRRMKREQGRVWMVLSKAREIHGLIFG
jgi:hypothetical protein